MEIRKTLFLYALFITLFLFMTILLISNMLSDRRENFIDEEIQNTYNSLNEMQTFLLMSEIYGDEMACLVFEAKLRDLDQSMWDLGRKIDQYRIASEEFQRDPYYLRQKQIFNENEVFYLMLLGKLKKQCGFDQSIISFFYKNSEECKKCDDQSFILTDINRDLDDELSIFSFDADLGLTSISLLADFYGITEYPCIVIDERPFCGLQNNEFIRKRICESSPKLSICPRRVA